MEYAEPGYQWREGGDKEIPGCKERERNPKMGELLRDGLHFNPKGCVVFVLLLGFCCFLASDGGV